MTFFDAADRLVNPFKAARPTAPPQKPVPAVARLELRALTGYEEEFIEQHRDRPNTAFLCNALVARCLCAPGDDATQALQRVREMPVPLRDAALVRIRQLSLGDVVHSQIVCPACGLQSEIDFALSQLPLELGDLPTEVRTTIEGSRPARLRLPTAGDQEALLDAPEMSGSERRTWLLSRVLLEIDGTAPPEGNAYVRGLSIRARRELEQALEQALPPLDLSMQVTCDGCEHVFVAPFDVAGFFLSS